MRYGFVIDQRRCIGCHACTVACKEEQGVPLGAFRTWVKYVERGAFPHTRRHFAVLRCNHCDRAPCVTICPTVALYRRPDGIVDFDPARCIGCKSCMHACPYDALYIDPDSGTAAKCNYCAHRVDRGLEPACVVVCPEQAIVTGDLDDPASPIARLVATEPTAVRKPGQGTEPKLFYVGAEPAALDPALQIPSERYLWAERPAEEIDLVRMVAAAEARAVAELTAADGADGHGAAADADGTARVVYDVPHAVRPWGWRVAAYLWTKAVAAGTLLVAAAAVLLGGGRLEPTLALGAPLVGLLFLALTTGLLVWDLKRPDRFLYILTKGNPRSWLVLGGWILVGETGLAGLWLLAGLTGDRAALGVVVPLAGLGALAVAGYSAFLFGQAEGRDFWQSRLVLPHLIAAAVAAGAAVLLGLPTGPRLGAFLRWALAGGLIGHAGLGLVELFRRHDAVDAARAARIMRRARPHLVLWGGAGAVGVALPLAVLLWAPAWVPLAALGALAGLWIWEDRWIRAGQSVPLS